LLLQNFNFSADDPSYKLAYKQTLTIKPKDFFMYATLREGIDPIHLERNIWNEGVARKSTKDKNLEKVTVSDTPQKPMTILYGSNTGTCESLAQTLANGAASHGYKAVVKSLDSASPLTEKDQPVVVVTSSYEGQPPDNAAHFVDWLQGLENGKLAGLKYAVFGCGHRNVLPSLT
jgi:cytochrome P450/NADPH-cytochrome P450 reductase